MIVSWTVSVFVFQLKNNVDWWMCNMLDNFNPMFLCITWYNHIRLYKDIVFLPPLGVWWQKYVFLHLLFASENKEVRNTREKFKKGLKNVAITNSLQVNFKIINLSMTLTDAHTYSIERFQYFDKISIVLCVCVLRTTT